MVLIVNRAATTITETFDFVTLKGCHIIGEKPGTTKLTRTVRSGQFDIILLKR